ncbi:MAG: DUF4077 domain-containing protein [Tumebacillaceae bacterium]
MFRWIKRKCFSDLMYDRQKNHLLYFITLLVYTFGESNILQNVSFMSPENKIYLIACAVLFVVGYVLFFIPKMEKAYKYIMMFLLMCAGFVQIGLFAEAPPVFQLVYPQIAISLIYMSGPLVLFTGFTTVVLTYLGFTMAHDQFFPTTPMQMMNIPLGLLVQTTVACWGVTQIGKYLMNTLKKEKEEVHAKAQELENTHKKIQETVIALQENFAVLKGNVQVSSHSSEEIKIAFQEIAVGTQVQAKNITSSALQLNEMESLTSNLVQQVEGVASNVEESLNLSNVSKQKIQNFEERMRILESVIKETGAVIRDLMEQSNQINDIVKLITGISNQTSLLALNANIEAARAGEHGRGFTVVANEVLKLADESQKSAERIQAILKRFQEKADIVEGQIEKGEKVQIESNQMLNEVLVNVENLSSFIHSLDDVMGSIVNHQQNFMERTQEIVGEVTHASSVTEETSAATEQVLASVEEEARRNKDSVRALENVNAYVNELQSIIEKK